MKKRKSGKKIQVKSGSRVGAVKKLKSKAKNKKELTLAETFVNLGNAYRNEGKFILARKAYEKALLEDSKLSVGYRELGMLYHLLGENEKAIKQFRKGLALDDGDVLMWHNLGALSQELHELSVAESAYEKSLAIDPLYEKSLNNLGGLYLDLGRNREALEICKRAVESNPKSAFNHNNLGVAYKNLFIYKKAVESFDAATALDSTFEGAYYNKGISLNQLGKVTESIAALKKAVKIKPDYAEALSFLLMRQKLVCDWRGVKKTSQMLEELTTKQLNAGEDVGELPYVNLFRTDNPAQNKKVAVSRSAMHDRMMSTVGEKFEHSLKLKAQSSKLDKIEAHGDISSNLPAGKAGLKVQSRKLKIGYLSYDFRKHPLGQQVADLFVHHDRKKVEVRAYSFGPNDGSDLRKRFEENADVFIDVEKMDHLSAAKKIYEDGVDVLVDLMGFTRGSRFEILTFRPAPIQVNWLGFPGTTGTNHLDYIVGDKVMMSLTEQKDYGEKIVHLPHCYSMASIPEMGNVKFSRSDFGLPADGVVLCSYNASSKISKETFDSWLEILKRVPESVLWLWQKNEEAGKKLQNYAQKKGISSERIIMAETLPLNLHMDRLSLADIALDTQIVSGGATTSQALWAGLPVVTIRGNHYMSRMSASMVNAVGMDELITYSYKEYEDLIVSLASDKEKLKEIRERLRKNLKTASLFDGKGFVQDLERAYFLMYEKWQNGSKPESIIVPDKDRKFSREDILKISDGEKLSRQGKELMDDKKLVWAQRVLIAATSQNPQMPEAWNNLGICAFKQKQFGNAIGAFKRAVRLKPGWVEALNNMGGVCGAMGRFEEAIITLEKALEIDPDHMGAKRNLEQAKEFLKSRKNK